MIPKHSQLYSLAWPGAATPPGTSGPPFLSLLTFPGPCHCRNRSSPDDSLVRNLLSTRAWHSKSSHFLSPPPQKKDLPQQQLCGPSKHDNLSLMPSWVTWAGWYHAQVHCQHAPSLGKYHRTLYSKNTLVFSHIPLPSKRHRFAWSLSGFESKRIPQNTRQKADSSLLQIILFHKLFQFDCVHTSVVFTDLKHAGKCVYWRNIPYTGKFQANICGKQFSKLQTQIFIPEEGCYKSSQRTETYHVTSVSSQLEGRPADLWTKNPSERCWECLIKSWRVYGQIKTQRGGRTKFMKHATHCNHLISVPITFAGQRSTLLAWHNSSKVWVKCNVFLSVCLANEQQCTHSGQHFAGYTLRNRGSWWWPPSLN